MVNSHVNFRIVSGPELSLLPPNGAHFTRLVMLDLNSVGVSIIEIVSDSNELFKKLEILKEHIPPNEATADEWWNFSTQLNEMFLTFFHLDRELITFSKDEVQVLEKYLYATKLIIDCKNAAVRVSRKEWEAIESRLLTPPGGEQSN